MSANYEKLSAYAKRMGISYQTAWRWFTADKIEGAHKINGSVFVPVAEEAPKTSLTVRAVTYARVSSSQNKANLVTQSERLGAYCSANGYQIVSAVSEIGSGMNDERKKMNAVFGDMNWDVLVVEHKDRLTRFGFSYLEGWAASQGRRIEVINLTDATDEADLMEDLVSIITSFCARLYGRRRSQRKTEKIIAHLNAGDVS